jgi:hypothetical protein
LFDTRCSRRSPVNSARWKSRARTIWALAIAVAKPALHGSAVTTAAGWHRRCAGGSGEFGAAPIALHETVTPVAGQQPEAVLQGHASGLAEGRWQNARREVQALYDHHQARGCGAGHGADNRTRPSVSSRFQSPQTPTWPGWVGLTVAARVARVVRTAPTVNQAGSSRAAAMERMEGPAPAPDRASSPVPLAVAMAVWCRL